jgi:hypothetical protein
MPKDAWTRFVKGGYSGRRIRLLEILRLVILTETWRWDGYVCGPHTQSIRT